MPRKLGRKIGHRKSLMRNLAASLVLYEKIETTEAKAKDVKSYVEHLITISKAQDLSAYRRLLAYFYDKNAAKKVYEELAARYTDRPSGFIHTYHIGNRLGDNSKMMRLELVDRKVFSATKKTTAEKAKDSENTEEKIDKKDIKAQRKLDKLSSTSQKGGVITSVRSKATRKFGDK
ncbi:MAG: 50S ribosomal protein L17 [Candidatus Berkelbacteria bacterium]|nr:50S ribosomal protein L17 [Candidatus Berkelbacteria bacterium]